MEMNEKKIAMLKMKQQNYNFSFKLMKKLGAKKKPILKSIKFYHVTCI